MPGIAEQQRIGEILVQQRPERQVVHEPSTHPVIPDVLEHHRADHRHQQRPVRRRLPQFHELLCRRNLRMHLPALVVQELQVVLHQERGVGAGRVQIERRQRGGQRLLRGAELQPHQLRQILAHRPEPLSGLALVRGVGQHQHVHRQQPGSRLRPECCRHSSRGFQPLLQFPEQHGPRMRRVQFGAQRCLQLLVDRSVPRFGS